MIRQSELSRHCLPNLICVERSSFVDFFLKLKNVGLNKTEKAVLRLLIGNPDRTADIIAAETGVSKHTIERTFISLQKKGNILIQFYKAKKAFRRTLILRKAFPAHKTLLLRPCHRHLEIFLILKDLIGIRIPLLLLRPHKDDRKDNHIDHD